MTKLAGRRHVENRGTEDTGSRIRDAHHARRAPKFRAGRTSSAATTQSAVGSDLEHFRNTSSPGYASPSDSLAADAYGRPGRVYRPRGKR
jgi:hypothetical protein